MTKSLLVILEVLMLYYICIIRCLLQFYVYNYNLSIILYHHEQDTHELTIDLNKLIDDNGNRYY